MAEILVTPPTAEPVSLDEAKQQLRITDDSDDGYIAGLIIAARQLVEDDTRRSLLTQSWLLTLDHNWTRAVNDLHARHGSHGLGGLGYPGGIGAVSYRRYQRIVVPRPPLQAVTAITYLDLSGAVQTLDPSQYVVNKAATGEWYIEPAFNVVWPSVLNVPNAIQIAFTAGYGDLPGSVPELLRIAMYYLVSQWYDNRNPLNTITRSGEATELPNAAEFLVRRYRVFY